MNWKYVQLHCPHCEFTHSFKRICWYERGGIYIGLYGSDDMKSRKDCQKELVYGETTYEALDPYMRLAAEAWNTKFPDREPDQPEVKK